MVIFSASVARCPGVCGHGGTRRTDTDDDPATCPLGAAPKAGTARLEVRHGVISATG